MNEFRHYMLENRPAIGQSLDKSAPSPKAAIQAPLTNTKDGDITLDESEHADFQLPVATEQSLEEAPFTYTLDSNNELNQPQHSEYHPPFGNNEAPSQSGLLSSPSDQVGSGFFSPEEWTEIFKTISNANWS